MHGTTGPTSLVTNQAAPPSDIPDTPSAGAGRGEVDVVPPYKQARSEKTYYSLLDSTLKVILREGYQNTTTPLIAKASGVSRGALNHHFSTKMDLMVAAADHLLRETAMQIETEATNATGDGASLGSFVDNMWKLFSGPFFYISLELIVASRTDPVLRSKMVPIVHRFHQALDQTWARHFGRAKSNKNEDLLLNMTLCLLRGMGAQTVLRDDPEYYREMLALWKRTLVREL